MTERLSLLLGRMLTVDLKREDGQGVTEYGLVLAFVAILLAAILLVLAGGISNFIGIVNDKLALLPGFS